MGHKKNTDLKKQMIYSVFSFSPQYPAVTHIYTVNIKKGKLGNTLQLFNTSIHSTELK